MSSLLVYGLLALAVLGSVTGLYVKVHSDGERQGEAVVQGRWDAANAAAQKQADAKAAADRQAKEKADAENQAIVAGLNARIRGLRDAARNTPIVPPAPAGASRPELACYDRTQFERAIGDFVESARSLADEGSKAALDLDTARRWAKP